MIKKLFWMFVGGGVALWGRKRTIDEVDKRLPKPAQRFLKQQVFDRIRRFERDVNRAERQKQLERELEELKESHK